MYVYIKFTICSSGTLQKSCFCPYIALFGLAATQDVKLQSHLQLKIYTHCGNLMENHKKQTFPREDNQEGWQDTFQPGH